MNYNFIVSVSLKFSTYLKIVIFINKSMNFLLTLDLNSVKFVKRFMFKLKPTLKNLENSIKMNLTHFK